MKILAVVLMSILVLLPACSSTGLTMKDYNKLKVGMEVSEAESILGMKIQGAKDVNYLGTEVTTGRFGPADGPHIALIVQNGQIRQLQPVDLK